MWRLHLAVLVITVFPEWIGVRELRVGPGVVLFVPLLYGFALGNLATVLRHSGCRLIAVSLLVFVGMYLGSAVIAEAVLTALGNS